MKNLFLKQLRLKNYCQFIDFTINFTNNNGEPYKFVCFFGPNGSGKSSVLNAIGLLTMNTAGRGEDRIKYSLAQYIFSEDYDPKLDKISTLAKSRNMIIEGTYMMDGQEYIVQITENGFVRNDFAPVIKNADLEDALTALQTGPWGKDHLQYRQRIAHFISTDNDLSLNKFQLHRSQMINFEDIVSEITRYPSKCVEPVGTTDQDMEFCTDFIITKPTHKVHYKSMSLGERKICKSFSILLNLMHALANPTKGEKPMVDWPRILLIDEVEKSVYYDRHVRLIDKLKTVFKEQQIITTSHSGILIPRFKNNEHDANTELYIDLEVVNCQ